MPWATHGFQVEGEATQESDLSAVFPVIAPPRGATQPPPEQRDEVSPPDVDLPARGLTSGIGRIRRAIAGASYSPNGGASTIHAFRRL